jgi:dihydrofolate synthase/folylpolyglutamate synthase
MRMAEEALAGFDPVEYINTPRWQESRMGLDRITQLMERLGNPQDSLRVVHVAGTNGKGSTCAYISGVLQAAGYRTGLFTSPYIIEFSDRIRIDGCNISPEALMRATLEVRAVAEAMSDHPTEFELMTAVAFVAFKQAGCECAVIEVGLGGRLDSTNVLSHPEVCVLAPIALDHTHLLGDTVEAIAREKAGIIKPGASVVSARQAEGAKCVIEQAAAALDAPITWVDADALSESRLEEAVQDGHAIPMRVFSYAGFSRLATRLLGTYQPQNAALAIEACLALRARGFNVSDEAICQGISSARWPGRFEIVAHEPTFIVDGGHNPQGARVLVESLKSVFPGRKVTFLVGVLADKDYSAMLRQVVPLGSAFVCVQPPNPRALSAQDLAEAIAGIAREMPAGEGDVKLHVAGDIASGVARARDIARADGLVCAFGSLYSIADIMVALRKLGA